MGYTCSPNISHNEYIAPRDLLRALPVCIRIETSKKLILGGLFLKSVFGRLLDNFFKDLGSFWGPCWGHF